MDDLVALLVSHGVAVVFLATLATRLGAPVPAAPFPDRGRRALGRRAAVLPRRAGWRRVAGNILGDGAWFLAGRRWGYSVMRLLCRISLSADTCVQRSESFLGRWGGASLIAAKFVPGVSVVAPPMAGALRMSNTRFLAYETLAALIWTLGFLLLGRLFHAAIADVLAVLANVGLTATADHRAGAGGLRRLALSPAPHRAARPTTSSASRSRCCARPWPPAARRRP